MKPIHGFGLVLLALGFRAVAAQSSLNWLIVLAANVALGLAALRLVVSLRGISRLALAIAGLALLTQALILPGLSVVVPVRAIVPDAIIRSLTEGTLVNTLLIAAALVLAYGIVARRSATDARPDETAAIAGARASNRSAQLTGTSQPAIDPVSREGRPMTETYCIHCATRLPAGANYCWQCGTPQKPGLQADEPKWEICEITHEADVGGLRGMKIKYLATAIGPNGMYKAGETPFVKMSDGQKTVEALVNQLVSDGWEPTGTGQFADHYKFRRRVR